MISLNIVAQHSRRDVALAGFHPLTNFQAWITIQA
jgi:hypothetical protein